MKNGSAVPADLIDVPESVATAVPTVSLPRAGPYFGPYFSVAP